MRGNNGAFPWGMEWWVEQTGWLGVKPPSPQIYRDAGGGEWGMQDLLSELWDGIKGASVHLAGAVLLAERCVPPAVVPEDREVSIVKCDPLMSPPRGRAGSCLSWGTLHGSLQPP